MAALIEIIIATLFLFVGAATALLALLFSLSPSAQDEFIFIILAASALLAYSGFVIIRQAINRWLYRKLYK